MTPRRLIWNGCGGLFFGVLCLAFGSIPPGDYRTWTLEEAQAVLNESPWAAQYTIARVIGGVGSGLYGEKEIYDRFFVRFLSARPVRQAYARVEQIRRGYDDVLNAEERRSLDQELDQKVEKDFRDRILVALTLRSNDSETEQQFWNTLQNQTRETLKNRVHLSSRRFPKVEIAAYYPPQEPAVGAVFVFPREIEGIPLVSEKDSSIVVEIDLPGGVPKLRLGFRVSEMTVNGAILL